MGRKHFSEIKFETEETKSSEEFNNKIYGY
jgi:hypothetical protein